MDCTIPHPSGSGSRKKHGRTVPSLTSPSNAALALALVISCWYCPTSRPPGPLPQVLASSCLSSSLLPEGSYLKCKSGLGGPPSPVTSRVSVSSLGAQEVFPACLPTFSASAPAVPCLILSALEAMNGSGFVLCTHFSCFKSLGLLLSWTALSSAASFFFFFLPGYLYLPCSSRPWRHLF